MVERILKVTLHLLESRVNLVPLQARKHGRKELALGLVCRVIKRVDARDNGASIGITGAATGQRLVSSAVVPRRARLVAALDVCQIVVRVLLTHSQAVRHETRGLLGLNALGKGRESSPDGLQGLFVVQVMVATDGEDQGLVQLSTKFVLG